MKDNTDNVCCECGWQRESAEIAVFEDEYHRRYPCCLDCLSELPKKVAGKLRQEEESKWIPMT